MTGEIPTDKQAKDVSEEFKARSKVSDETIQFVKSLPKNLHPMTQLSQAVLYLQQHSLFAQAYRNGVHKSKYWDASYEDATNLIAKLPTLAALIYRNVYKDGKVIAPDSSLDWTGNYAHMLGFSQHEVQELLRGYLCIHRFILIYTCI